MVFLVCVFFFFQSINAGRPGRQIVTILSRCNHNNIYSLGVAYKWPRLWEPHVLPQVRLNHNLSKLHWYQLQMWLTLIIKQTICVCACDYYLCSLFYWDNLFCFLSKHFSNTGLRWVRLLDAESKENNINGTILIHFQPIVVCKLYISIETN